MPGNLISITAHDIAAWPAPNYVDPVQRTWMPIYLGVLYAASTLMVAVRLWLRCTNKGGGRGLDDAFLVPAWAASTMFVVVVIVPCVKYGMARHIWDIPPEDFEPMAMYAWLAEFAFLVASGCTKISVLLFYRRLVDGSYRKRWTWAVRAAIAFTALYSIAFLFILIFNCHPTNAYWKSFNPEYQASYTCVNTRVINILAGVVSVASDLYSVALPCIMIIPLGLHAGQKTALNVIFSLGLLVVAASVVRTYYLWAVGQRADVSWLLFNTFVWAQLEVQLGIMCASAPALRVFFRSYLSAPLGRAVRSSSWSARSQQFGRRSEMLWAAVPEEKFLYDETSTHESSTTATTKDSVKVSCDDVGMLETEIEKFFCFPTMPRTHLHDKTAVGYEAYRMQRVDGQQKLAMLERPENKFLGNSYSPYRLRPLDH